MISEYGRTEAKKNAELLDLNSRRGALGDFLEAFEFLEEDPHLVQIQLQGHGEGNVSPPHADHGPHSPGQIPRQIPTMPW